MSVEQNKQLVHSVSQAFAKGDLASVFANMSDDVVWLAPETSPMASKLGLSNELKGKAAIVDFVMSGVPKVFPQDIQMEVRSVHGDGDTVISELTERGDQGDRSGGC